MEAKLAETEKKEWLGNTFVSCPRFGGTRMAPVCVHADRYRFCRRSCSSIEKLLKDRPDFLEEAKDFYEKYAKDKNLKAPTTKSWIKHGAPKPKISCPHCSFKAKSERGLKAHITRSHKKKKEEHPKLL